MLKVNFSNGYKIEVFSVWLSFIPLSFDFHNEAPSATGLLCVKPFCIHRHYIVPPEELSRYSCANLKEAGLPEPTTSNVLYSYFSACFQELTSGRN